MMKLKNDWPSFVKLVKKRFRKKFKKDISSKEIKKIWDDFVQYKIIDGVIDGGEVKIDKYSTIQLIGTPVYEDKIMGVLRKGRSIRRDGTMKIAEFHRKRNDIKYKIVYKNSLGKTYFKAAFSKQVHEALITKNNYYHVHQ